jgi:hypothetical protein
MLLSITRVPSCRSSKDPARPSNTSMHASVGTNATETPILLFRREHSHRQFENWTMGFHRLNNDASKRPPGLNEFLATGLTTTITDVQGEKIRKVLLGFREGRWHRLVDN